MANMHIKTTMLLHHKINYIVKSQYVHACLAFHNYVLERNWKEFSNISGLIALIAHINIFTFFEGVFFHYMMLEINIFFEMLVAYGTFVCLPLGSLGKVSCVCKIFVTFKFMLRYTFMIPIFTNEIGSYLNKLLHHEGREYFFQISHLRWEITVRIYPGLSSFLFQVLVCLSWYGMVKGVDLAKRLTEGLHK